MDSVGEGEGGKIWENDIETFIIFFVGLNFQPMKGGFRMGNTCIPVVDSF